MTLKQFIKFRLSKLYNQPVEVQRKGLEKLYRELEERGIHHTAVFCLVNEILCENLKRRASELKSLLEDF